MRPRYALRHRAMAQEHSGTSRLEPHTPLSRATPETEELSHVPFPVSTLTRDDEPVLEPLQARPLLAEVLELLLPKLAQAALLLA
jgi:hypothetical protein